MPDHPYVWIRSERGVRRLQHEELGKAKGVPPEWIKDENGKPLRQTMVDGATCLHLWTVAMDTLRSWLDKEETPKSRAARKDPEEQPIGEWSTPEEDDAYQWEWREPDLQEGGAWHEARIQSLKKAIHGRKDRERLLEEGLEALNIHRGNYSEEGPKYLQLLWWEFPKEHHDALREGCRMNFLITPEGELQLNAEMDDDERITAGKFVDELS